jgi:DNA-binding transcriptional LysR family regulator
MNNTCEWNSSMKRIVMERSGELEVFVRVVHEGGFSAAARSLGLSPSAVSKLIGRLEARIGTRLFMRTTRALTLTEEGEAYFQAGQQLIEGLNAAEQAAAAGSVRGRLRINTSVPFGTMFATRLIPAFLASYPDVIVELSLTDEVVDLHSQKTDIAIRVGNLSDSSLYARRLGQSRRVVCAAPGYLARRGRPEKPEDLREHNCLSFNFRRTRSGWPFQVSEGLIEPTVSGNLQVNNGETMKQMLLAGVGIGRLAYWHVAAEIKAGELLVLLEDHNPGDLELIHAIYVGGSLVPDRVRAFIDHTVAKLEQGGWSD